MADRGIVVTTGNAAYVASFGKPLHRTVRQVLDGCFECVRPRGLPEPYVMLVNDEGLIQHLPMNLFGSFLYGTFGHGQPIVGDVILMKTGYRDGEPDIIGLDDGDIERLMRAMARCPVKLRKQVRADEGC